MFSNANKWGRVHVRGQFVTELRSFVNDYSFPTKYVPGNLNMEREPDPIELIDQ